MYKIKTGSKRVLALLLVLILCIIPSGCTREQTGAADTGANVRQVTVTDALGRQVTVSKTPERIVSGYYINTSAVIALGLKDRLVGIEAKADKRKIYSLAAPELAQLPNVGSVKQFDLEAAIALKPDLVILPKKLSDFAKNFEEVNIPVLFVNPESTAEMKEMINNIASLCGVEQRAGELLEFMDEKLDKIGKLTADVTGVRTYIAGNSSYLKTAGANMYQNDLLKNAGAVNVAEEITENYWADISYEQLLVYNPEAIIISADAEYTADDLMSDENLSSLTAVKTGAVYAIPSGIEAWDSPVPSAFLGSLWIAGRLYPEKYSSEEFVEDVSQYYTKYYGISITGDMIK